MSILVVMEQRAGEWNRMSFETLAAAQQLAGELKTTASAAILGTGLDALAAELAAWKLDKVYTVGHELLQSTRRTPGPPHCASWSNTSNRITFFSRTPTRFATFCPSSPLGWARWQ